MLSPVGFFSYQSVSRSSASTTRPRAALLRREQREDVGLQLSFGVGDAALWLDGASENRRYFVA